MAFGMAAKNQLEDEVRRDVQEYLGTPLAPGDVVVGRREDGSPLSRHFDLVSPDGAVIGSIQTSCLRIKSRPGQKAFGSLYRVLGALLYLHLCHNCQRRYLILTDRDMYREITTEFAHSFPEVTILFWEDIKPAKR